MTSLQAKLLLVRLANIYRKEKAVFSRQEIVQKINQIKYLSAQKKVPKLTLRKELIHLENKLQSVFEIEQKLREQKKHESQRIAVMKRQMNKLKNQVTLCEDKNLQQKVDKLSYLLGDYLAKKEMGVKESKRKPQKIIAKVKAVPIPLSLTQPEELQKLTPEEIAKIKSMQVRLKVLKQELELDKQMGKESLLPQLEQKITQVERKLNQYYYQRYIQLAPVPESFGTKPEVFTAKGVVVELPTSGSEQIPLPEEIVNSAEIKHDILFDFPTPKVEAEAAEETSEEKVFEMDLLKELPLPPPPKVTRK
jgi:hypothetical protein